MTKIAICKTLNKEIKMKRIIFLLVLGFLLIANPLFAEEEKLQLTVGVKAWYNEWTTKFDTGYGTPNTKWFTSTSDPTLALGPTISFKKGKYFGGISFLQTVSDYENDYIYRDSAINRRHMNQSISRYDIDTSVGYYFHPRLGGFIGYKHAAYEVTNNEEDIDNSGTITARYSTTSMSYVYGPVIGLTANYPLGATGLTPFLNLSYYWLRGSYDDRTNWGNLMGPSAELGLAYTLKKLTFTAAYKGQNLYATDGSEEKFRGPMLSVNYTF